MQLSDSEIEARLTEVSGVGPWTVHGFLIIALDRPDVMLAGDVALRRAVRAAYAPTTRLTQPRCCASPSRGGPTEASSSCPSPDLVFARPFPSVLTTMAFDHSRRRWFGTCSLQTGSEGPTLIS